MATREEDVRAAIERARTRQNRSPAFLFRSVGLERGAGINPGPSGDFSAGAPPASRTPATLAPGSAAGTVAAGIGAPEPARTEPARVQPVTQAPAPAPAAAPSGPQLPTDATIRGDVGTLASAEERGPTVVRPATEQTLTGDVGTQAGTTPSAVATGGGVGAAPAGTVPVGGTAIEQSRRVAARLGVLGPEDAPVAEAPARVDAETRQQFRDTVQAQQEELFRQYQEAQAAYAAAPTESSPEASRTRTLLRNRVELLGGALGQSTEGGVGTFAANRGFDQGVTTAGINADTDVAVANATNATRLGIAQGQGLVDLFTGITSANATERAAQVRAAADAAPDPLTQFRLQLAIPFLEANDPFTAFRIADGQAIDPQQLISDDFGNVIGVRGQNGQIIPLDDEQLAGILNRLQQIADQ